MNKKFLFIPVSSTKGIGEYMRSLIIADEINRVAPDSEIYFILNRYAPYSVDCPYPTELIESSPTKHIAEVNDFIDRFQPDVVLFDASGRKAQLKKAKQIGARTIFLSQHEKKRSRGMKWGRAKYTDFHFVVQPWFVIPPVSPFERLKFKILNKPTPECIGTVYSKPSECAQKLILDELKLSMGNFILFSAGSGGHSVGEKLAADIFLQSAIELTKTTGIKAVMVMGPNYPKPLPNNEEVVIVSSIKNDDFISVLSASRAAVLSGGDALLQAIAIGVPTLACPVSKDQPARISLCERHHLIKSTVCENLHIDVKALRENRLLEKLRQNMSKSTYLNGLKSIIEAAI